MSHRKTSVQMDLADPNFPPALRSPPSPPLAGFPHHGGLGRPMDTEASRTAVDARLFDAPDARRAAAASERAESADRRRNTIASSSSMSSSRRCIDGPTMHIPAAQLSRRRIAPAVRCINNKSLFPKHNILDYFIADMFEDSP